MSQARRTGFTLIELLVVMSIIAVLICNIFQVHNLRHIQYYRLDVKTEHATRLLHLCR